MEFMILYEHTELSILAEYQKEKLLLAYTWPFIYFVQTCSYSYYNNVQ